MIQATTFAGKNVAVFGLGATGLATIASLQAAGANVTAFDDNAASCADVRKQGIHIADLRQVDWQQIDALVLSPGVPLTHPEPHWTVGLAKESGVEIIGDTEILVRELEHRSPQANLVAITGTNGKSTTTALLGHVLKCGGIATQIGGNIGKPVLELDLPGPDQALVVEFSSYQIDLTPTLCPRVSILLNLSYDHIDRHGSMANYASVKARIFARQGSGDVAVIGVDDQWSQDIYKMLNRDVQVLPVSCREEAGTGLFAKDAVLYDATGDLPVAVADLHQAPALKGVHNWQNAAAVYAAARALGLTGQVIEQGFRTFPGLAHRMECVGHSRDAVFINDTKATNADAAARALATFDHIYWIAGGLAKEGGIESLRPYFGKIIKAYLIGDAADRFARTLGHDVKFEIAGTMEKAVAAAARDVAVNAQQTDSQATVLLAPACASFDQYRRFELRGDAFRTAVAGLEGVNMKQVDIT
ncbi:MAG TPA: UDP-N-acetylmuramoyl-L-alanine--D-glutamate ligase [Rhizobiales bacterium]|nr:UDP-N-acetylmuramoyl-L-alanine--D-glutamate ligase [Hyphomicrobiales bacterium]